MLVKIIIFLAYNLLQILVFPFFLVYLLYRKFSGKKIFGSFKHRIGLVPKAAQSAGPTIWIHAVSVGEVLSVQYFIFQLKKQKPNLIIYLTVGTPAGKEIAQKNIAADVISFMPYDFLPFILLAFWRIRPSKIFIVEAEIWPNMLILADLFKIKKYLINARVSTRSYSRYKCLKSIFAPLFNSFEKIHAQSEQDRQRFITLHVNQDKIAVLGDIKIFNVYQKWQVAQANEQKKASDSQEHAGHNILLVGSLHPGELDFYIKLYQELKPIHPDLKMILAPRHFHWVTELENKIKNAGLNYFTWTEQNDIRTAEPDNHGKSQANSLAHAITQIFKSHDILLVCKLGELFNLYQFADIFYLGGTFVNIGGHNLLEPAVWSNACIIGPHYQNTQVVADQMQKAGGLIKIDNKTDNFAQLLQASQKLLADHNLIKQMGKCNFAWLTMQATQVDAAIQEIIKDA